jgi:hypothetical protein
MQKKKEEYTVDYCCNPQCIVWGNSDSPTPFRVLFEKYKKKMEKLCGKTPQQSTVFNQVNI